MLIAVIVIAVLAIGVYFKGNTLKTFSIFSDQETIYKQEYNTYWSNKYDESFIVNSPPSPHRGILWNCDVGGSNGVGQVWTTDSGDLIVAGGGGTGGYGSCQSTKNFVGQEVVAIVDASARGGTGITIPYFNNYGGEGIILFKPYNPSPVGHQLYDISLNGIIILKGYDMGMDFKFSMMGNGYGSVALKYLGFKAQYSCDLSSDEVWIQENFAQSFSIKDLEFIPTKFCKETRPFVLRDIQQGETPYYPDPIPSFNKGGVLEVSSGKIGVVNYATYFVSGVNNKCAPNEANIKVAGKWICSQVIKPVEVVVQCKVNEDCPQPLKNLCPNYFVGCQNSKCIYDDTILNSVVCKNEVVTIIKQILEVDKRTVVPITGVNVFTFSQYYGRTQFNIGDLIFTATPPEFSCQFPDEVDFVSAPNPKSECWQTTISFNGKQFKLKDTEKTTIYPNIDVQYFSGGKASKNPSDTKPEDWSNTFIFTIDNTNAMGLNVEDSSFVLKDTEKKIKLNLINNLPKGDVKIKVVQQIKTTNQYLPENIIEQIANKGNNEIYVDMDTHNSGINQIPIQVFYKIKADNEILIPSDKFVLNYNIVDELPTTTKIVEVEKEKIVVQEKVVIKEIEKEIEVIKIIKQTPSWVWWALIIIVLAIVGFLVWKIYGD